MAFVHGWLLRYLVELKCQIISVRVVVQQLIDYGRPQICMMIHDTRSFHVFKTHYLRNTGWLQIHSYLYMFVTLHLLFDHFRLGKTVCRSV